MNVQTKVLQLVNRQEFKYAWDWFWKEKEKKKKKP